MIEVLEKKSTADLLLYFFRAYPRQSISVIVALILAGLAETLGIGALLPLITMVIGGADAEPNALTQVVDTLYVSLGIEPSIVSLLALIVFAITLKACIFFQAMRYVSYVAADVARDLRMQLINALMRARWSYFSTLPVGMISNTISMEAQRAGHCYMLAGRTMAAGVQALVYVCAAFVVSWQVSVLAVVMGGLIAFLVKRFMGMARQAGKDTTETNNIMLSRLNESLSGVKPLKAMGQESRYIAQLEKDTGLVMAAQRKQALSSLLLQIVYEPLAVFILACGLFYVLTFTHTPAGSVFLLAFLFYRLMTNTQLLQSFYQNMINSESAVWQLKKEIQKAGAFEECAPEGGKPKLEEVISIDNIDIAYGENKPVLNKFSARIPAKAFTVIFGPSGVGKTTLLDAILKLTPLNGGKITVDGIDLEEIDTRLWRHAVGYVPQETFLFHDSVMQNITLGDGAYSEADVKAALEQAEAWGFVEKLPEGLQTIVGERGGRLSGGQRQRIALARALIRKPDLLVLDEATTGLDHDSERLVLETIKGLSNRITVISISHNPKILEYSDHVIRLDEPMRQIKETA
ncbi:MAG: ABC transporter ATP-binding protein [Alphaproteobacteria bacterium]